MPGRSFSNGTGYRFGFNGQEQDNDINGKGNLNTATFWEYDTRLGRRWNVDPVVKLFESSYLTFANNPILFKDSNGDDPSTEVEKQKDGTYKVVNAKNDGDNNIYEVNKKGQRLKTTDPVSKKESYKVLGQTLNAWDFMLTNDNTGELYSHADVNIDFSNGKVQGSLPEVTLPKSGVKISDVKLNMYGSNLIVYLNQYFLDAVKYEGLLDPYNQCLLLQDLSGNAKALDIKAFFGAYTPIKLSEKSNTFTTIRAIGNLAFGMNLRATFPGPSSSLRFYYNKTMEKVGAYNQSQALLAKV
jgi:hypothetical protein